MNKKRYEEMINELERIIRELEIGNLTLEESVEKFSSAKELSNLCRIVLNEASEKIVGGEKNE